MFFGREDDFAFVIRKIGEVRTNQIIVFCGERRSGKTSILFQILGGRLGEDFLPVLVDMQILAGIRSDYDLFRNFLKNACSTLDDPGIDLAKLEEAMDRPTVEGLFGGFFSLVERRYPGKIVLFLLDEYELIEAKIRDDTLSENTIHYLAGLLEGGHRVSFVFTGSTNLEDRKEEFWKSLLGKSIYRKISYLSESDTHRLITEPLQDYVSYPEEVTDSIYRLTGGQPFYTQVICQNIVDHLIEEERDDPDVGDLKTIVGDIVDNPLPQMIYSWNNQQSWLKIILSSAAALIESPSQWVDAPRIYAYLKKNRLIIPFQREKVNVLLEEAYHDEVFDKKEGSLYRFKMDLFRKWIRREHSLWQVTKEVGLEFRSSLLKAMRIGLSAAGVLAAAAVVWFVVVPLFQEDASLEAAGAPAETAAGGSDAAAEAAARPQAAAAVEQPPAEFDVVLVSNRSPFRVMIDAVLNLTSEGQKDEKSILVPDLQEGSHSLVFVDPASGEKIEKTVDVGEEGRRFSVRFTKPIPKEPVEGAAERREEAAAADAAAAGTGAATEAAQEGSSQGEGGDAEEPAEQQPAAPRLGALFLNSDPPGAEIRIGGKESDLQTPSLIDDFAPGDYRIVIAKEGYRKETFVLKVGQGETVKREVTLTPTFGSITLDIRPTAKIYLDGEFLVETPYAKPLEVPTGNHILTLKNESLGIEEEVPFALIEGEEKHFTKELKE